MSEPLTAETRDLIALTLVPGLGPKLTAALLRHFGSAGAVRRASAERLREVGQIGEKLSRDFAAALARVDENAEVALIERHFASVIGLGSPGYPSALATIPGAPPLLYVIGQLTAADEKSVAIVGSRGCTAYGRRVAERLATGLARAGFTIISGLARGIDGIAHQAALKAGGRTIAVLAGGLARIYPPEHKELAREVTLSGALVSEAPMATEPFAELFPSRNRIISGLARGVIIVEASERSGTLITARHAGDQGRDVFAVPGPVDSAASSGCLRLIREGATLIRDVDDVLEALASAPQVSAEEGAPEATNETTVPAPELTGTARSVWEFLADGARYVDVIAQDLGIAVPELTVTLMTLEMKKLVRRLPGNQYERR